MVVGLNSTRNGKCWSIAHLISGTFWHSEKECLTFMEIPLDFVLRYIIYLLNVSWMLLNITVPADGWILTNIKVL